MNRLRSPAGRCFIVGLMIAVQVVCLLSRRVEAQRTDDEAERLFRQEYAQAARMLEWQAENLRCRLVMNSRWDAFPIDEHVFVRGESRGEIREYRNSSPKGGVFGKVHVATPEKLFAAFRYQPAGSYVLMQYVPNPTVADRNQLVRLNVDRYVYAPFAVLGFKIRDLLESGNMQVERVTEEAAEGSDLPFIVVEFALRSPLEGLVSGAIVVSPSEHWVLRAFRDCKQVNAAGAYVLSSGQLTYKAWPGGIYYPRRMVLTEYWSTDGQTHPLFEADVTEVSRGSVQESEFSLAAYGLASESQPQARTISIFVIVNILAVAAVACFLAARYLRQRRQK